MKGAMSQMDTWEYKPQLQKDDGKVGPGGGTLDRRRSSSSASTARPAPGSRSCSRNLARHVDKLCFLRGLHTDTPAHPQAVIQLHTGTALASLTRPSMGAWLLYGLGPRTRTCPATSRSTRRPTSAARSTTAARSCRPTSRGRGSTTPATCRTSRPQTARSLQRKQLDLIQAMNRDLAATPGAPDQLDGVIQSYELAFRMQGKVPELLDISKEPQAVLDAYGVKPGPAGSFARQCLMARRLSEAGVRFVEICQPGWDHHSNLHQGLIRNCGRDRPAHRRAAGRPGAARAARRDAGALRQRVRPPADRPGPGRPRPQHHRLPDVAGRRRREEGLLATAAPTSTACTRSRAGCTPPTCTPRCWP